MSTRLSEPSAAASMAALRFAEHKAFLRLVHSALGGGDELYLGRALPGAIERYLGCWLPLVAREGGEGTRLIPPVDIAWVWHLHRLAPLRYAAYCTERFGRVLDPGTAAFQAAVQSTAAQADGETRRLWRQHFGDEPFFQRRGEGESSPTEWGPRDPLSNQTTLSATVKEACALVRSAHEFDYDVETCSARQRTFLWQVSQPACSDGPAASERYLHFLGLMKKHGYERHFFVPSYDIDFAWHTHMLSCTSAYLRETELLAAAPGGVGHDDSVNQRHEQSKLHRGWAETKELWALEHGDTADADLETAGATYRGEPPDWWFQSEGSEIYRVVDGFLSEAEVEDALERLRCESNIRGRAHSGLDMVCQVSADVMRRLRGQLDAERAVAGQDWAGLPPPAAAEPEQDMEPLVEVPARVCPATKSVPSHKDKEDGKGAPLSSWISIVYLTHQPGSALVLVDDVTGREFRVAIEPGRLCCWPNARFSHRVDVDSAVAAADAVNAAQALWQQLQQQLQALEVRLAQIADLSDPPKGLDAWCNGCCAFDKTKINAFKAVAAQIKATRDVHMASVNVQLDGIALPRSRSVHNVRLCFGGGNSAYYLDAVPRPQGYSAAQVLQEAQAAEQAARSARAWAGDIELPTTAAVTPANAAVGQQLMMVQVPAGLSGGQPLQVQTPAGVMAVQIPQGLTAGQSFQIQVPQAVQPPVMGQPVMGQPAAQPVAPMAPATLQMDHAWGVSSA